MGRGLRGLAATVISVVGLAVIGPGAALAGTLDQAQTDGTGAATTISMSQSAAQTFTAGLSGGLDRVDLYLDQGGTPLPLNVEIRNVSGVVPGNAVLATKSVPAASVPMPPGAFVSINFAAPAPVLAGTRYAIVAWSSATPAAGYGWSESSTSDSYTRGDPFVTAMSSPPTGGWGAVPDKDHAFKTYVVPPTPGPTGQRAAALKKCKKKHSHKKRKKCKKRANLLPV